MRVLHTVEFYYPSVGGAQEVVRRISEELARRGHDVTVATTKLSDRRSQLLNGVRIEEFDISGNAVRGLSGEVDRYEQYLCAWDGDVMMNYAAQQWATDIALPLLPEIPAAKVLAPCGFSGLFEPSYRSYFANLPAYLEKYDHLIFHCDRYRDVEFAQRHGIRSWTVVPNGASEREFEGVRRSLRARFGIADGVALLLTVGSHTGMKGHRLVIEAFRRARIGRALLLVIGNTPASGGCAAECAALARRVTRRSLGKKRVLLLDLPRHDVVAAYQSADLFVFGSSIECSPIVLYEAVAARTPFVSVAAGNAAEIAAWTGGGEIVETTIAPNGEARAEPETFARAIEDLVARPTERRCMAESGHRAWRARFTWEGLAGEYERIYEAVARGSTI